MEALPKPPRAQALSLTHKSWYARKEKQEEAKEEEAWVKNLSFPLGFL
jgi:hypothetical protein